MPDYPKVKSPKKDLPRPYQAGDRALNQDDLDDADELTKRQAGFGFVDNPTAFRRAFLDMVAAHLTTKVGDLGAKKRR